MLKINKFLFFIITFIFALAVATCLSPSKIELLEGKNIVTMNLTESFYAESLVKLNPSIEVISYHDGIGSVGYLNFMEGLGENFIIRDGGVYEIILKENSTIIFP